MPFRIGPTELIIILVIVLIIFGVGRLPEIGGAMGKAIREFRKSQSGETSIIDAVESEATREISKDQTSESSASEAIESEEKEKEKSAT